MAHLRQSRPDSDRIAPGGLQETSAALEKVTVDAAMVPASREQSYLGTRFFLYYLGTSIFYLIWERVFSFEILATKNTENRPRPESFVSRSTLAWYSPPERKFLIDSLLVRIHSNAGMVPAVQEQRQSVLH